MTVAVERNPIRRAVRRTRPADLEYFTNDIEEALAAFRVDVTYAVQMARSAVAISRKRQVWQNRRELRDSECAEQQGTSL